MPLGPSFHYRFVQVSKLVIFSVLKFVRCSRPIKGPGMSISWQGNKAACQGTAWTTSDSQGHLWSLLPLALSLGTGESPVLETFTISSPAMLSESLEEVQAGVLRLFARGH